MRFLRWLFGPGCLEPMIVGALWGQGVLSGRVVLVLWCAFVADHLWGAFGPDRRRAQSHG